MIGSVILYRKLSTALSSSTNHDIIALAIIASIIILISAMHTIPRFKRIRASVNKSRNSPSPSQKSGETTVVANILFGYDIAVIYRYGYQSSIESSSPIPLMLTFLGAKITDELLDHLTLPSITYITPPR